MLEGIFTTNRGAVYIAEIGINHNGDPDMARKMIAAAAEAGADAVKFQVFVPELMNSVFTAGLLGDGREGPGDETMIDFFRRFVFTAEQYRELKIAADEAGVVFFASSFDLPSLGLLEGLGVGLHKLASSEITNDPLIAAVAETGRPCILSTGICTESEIAHAVELFRGKSRAELVLMHCVSVYPMSPGDANLNRIASLKERFNLETGYSDHSNDIVAPVLAAARGARIFEKHFTIDRFYDCPDKEVSLPPADFRRMIDSVEMAVVMMGEGLIDFSEAEVETARAARRSLFAKRFIPAGKVIEEDDVVALRPGVGIPAYEIMGVVGKTSRVDIPRDYIIKREYFS